MKRGFPDKVKHSPAYGAVHRGITPYGGVTSVKQSEVQRPSLALVLNSTAEANLETHSPDFVFLNENLPVSSLESNRHRRVRTSAAMVGLALSVGASDVLSLWNMKGALAAEAPLTLEPIQNSQNTTETVTEAAAIVPPALKSDDVAFSSTDKLNGDASPAFDLADYYPEELYSHQVAESETLWGIAQHYGLEPEVLASLNHLSVNSPLQVGQVLQFPRVFITKNLAEVEPQNTANQQAPHSAEDKATVKSAFLQTSNTGANVKSLQKGSPEAAPVVPLSLQTAPPEKDQGVPIAFLPNANPSSSTSDVGLSDLMPYRVRSGDTLDKIARTYHVSRASLVSVNQIQNPNLLKVDQVIAVPRTNLDLSLAPDAKPTENAVPVVDSLKSSAKTPAPEAAPAPVSSELASVLKQDASSFPYQPNNALSGELNYQVRPGDTLSKIARSYGLPVSALVQANTLANPNIIRVNQKLVIPNGSNLNVPLASAAPVQVAVNPSSGAEVALGQPMAPQDVSDEVQVKGTTTLQVNTAVIPTVPSLQSIVQKPIALPQPKVAVSPVDVPAVAIAPSEVASPYQPNQGVKIPAQTTPAEASIPSSDHISPLLSEVKALREQYRAGSVKPGTASGVSASLPQKEGGIPLAVIPAPASTATVPSVLPVSDSTAAGNSIASRSVTPRLSSGDRINPEFNPQAYRTMEAQPTPGTDSPQLLAAASIGSSSYEPLVQSLVGQTVSPALPSLSSDPYLPKDRTFTGYMWPAKGVLTSGFGWRWGRMHKGIDIAAPIGTPVMAAASGTVISAGWNDGGYGNLVEIQHPDGSTTLYAHNDRILVHEGQSVQQGQQISEMGTTGYSTGPHLHFEIHPSGQGAVNPMAYLPQ